MTTVIRKLPQAFVGVFLKAGKETRSFKDVMNCLFL
ncbi:ribosome maturation factor RimM, partial [Limosilactobacillus fermentum]